ncbi:MAG: class II D-tagatose-bisphosphate aldolase, non-catalytic subunit [Actinomycetia bacterium]|nr:class II D-tagatose-bisphosphate aldolase, non-catalytic subunit [Actinomycetes bacterium]
MTSCDPHPLTTLLAKRKDDAEIGIYSACTAHPLVLEAVIEAAQESDTIALIEATANQVDQFGGYTGMVPQDFAELVRGIAQEIGLPAERLILGGDHLGPLVWHDKPEAEAMELAEQLVRAYVEAGYTKIHIDTTMRLADDDTALPLDDETIARRAARLVTTCEDAYAGVLAKARADKLIPLPVAPVYVIGSEVPIPGGAEHNEEEIQITTGDQFVQTYETFTNEFKAQGLDDALSRIVGVVVQPGVEFSDASVSDYDHEKAAELCAQLDRYPSVVFEGHSTDYQDRESLKEMVEDGIALLKVGPALTFALRETLFALSDIEEDPLLDNPNGQGSLSHFKEVLVDAMKDDPTYWQHHYHSKGKKKLDHQLKYSLSDRCRYYLSYPQVKDSIDTLMNNIDTLDIPASIWKSHLPQQYHKVRDGELALEARALVKDHIKDRIADYLYATGVLDE